MAAESPWFIALRTGLVLFVTPLLMVWLARLRKPAKESASGLVLRTNKSLPILGYVCSAFFLVAAGACFFTSAGEWQAGAILLRFSTIGAPLILEGRARHEITFDGLRYRGMFRRVPLVRWAELRSASYQEGVKWLVVETENDGKLRFSAGLDGFEELGKSLLELAPNLMMNEKTYAVLDQARNGNPPSLWQ
jgi:hypothetical protein